jgi:hypothetical protein
VFASPALAKGVAIHLLNIAFVFISSFGDACIEGKGQIRDPNQPSLVLALVFTRGSADQVKVLNAMGEGLGKVQI